jgi:hypothetical protein
LLKTSKAKTNSWKADLLENYFSQYPVKRQTRYQLSGFKQITEAASSPGKKIIDASTITINARVPPQHFPHVPIFNT